MAGNATKIATLGASNQGVQPKLGKGEGSTSVKGKRSNCSTQNPANNQD